MADPVTRTCVALRPRQPSQFLLHLNLAATTNSSRRCVRVSHRHPNPSLYRHLALIHFVVTKRTLRVAGLDAPIDRTAC